VLGIIKKVVPAALVVVLAAWVLSGFFTVNSGEEAVVFRFGAHVRTITEGGLKWHFPYPFETVQKEKVSEVRRLEFGFRTVKEADTRRAAEYQTIPEESLMITGDENLINVETIVQYQIVDIEKYLFNVNDQEQTLRVAAESIIRRVVAGHTMDDALTENKFAIQQEIKDALQGTVNEYNLGIVVSAVQLQDVYPPSEVDAAFKDVVSAKEDKNSLINQAQAYANEVIPKARGNAAETLNKAQAYKEQRISEAQGDVAAFSAILEKYSQGKEVTRTRMYLETLEQVLPGMEKYIVSSDGNTVKWLPIGGGAPVTAPAN
jgi:membrane protease subunit HflK